MYLRVCQKRENHWMLVSAVLWRSAPCWRNRQSDWCELVIAFPLTAASNSSSSKQSAPLQSHLRTARGVGNRNVEVWRTERGCADR